MKAIDLLKKMDMERKLAKSTLPTHAIPKSKFSPTSSNGLTKCIIAMIELSGGYAVRIQVQGQYNESLGMFTKSHTRKGTADIHAIYKGRHISIEVKYGKDRMSKEQIATKNMVEDAGGIYMIARSFETWYEDFTQLEPMPHVKMMQKAIEYEMKTAIAGTEESVLKRLYMMLSKWLE